MAYKHDYDKILTRLTTMSDKKTASQPMDGDPNYQLEVFKIFLSNDTFLT